MLLNIYIGSVIISFLLFYFTILSINLRLKKLDGYKKYAEQNKDDFCKRITTWTILASFIILPIVNLILGFGTYMVSEEVYYKFKNKIEVYDK